MITTIYLDNNATTRTDPRVVAAMLPFFTDMYGNAASVSHSFGWSAEEAVERAREETGALIGADAREIVFTSGATEACNLALKGIASLHGDKPPHIVTQVTEHPAVLETAAVLEQSGVRVTYLPVDRYGQVAPGDVSAAIGPETALVSIMAANNEIGTINDLAAIGEVCAARNVLFHTDATQAVGKIPIDVERLGIHLLSLSAHKFHGPKGVGALYIRRRNPRVRLITQMDGGGQERGRRSGTLNVPGIVGLGEASRISREALAGEQIVLARLRDRLIDGILGAVDGAALVGHPARRLPNNASIYLPGIESDALLAALPDVAISSGSACSSAAVKPSHVLSALPGPADLARSTVRAGVSRFTTEAEVDTAVRRIAFETEKLRRLTPAAPHT